MEEISILRKDNNTQVNILNDPYQDIPYCYDISNPTNNEEDNYEVFAGINFQHGNGNVNGCTEVDLLSIVQHRLENIQKHDGVNAYTNSALYDVTMALVALEQYMKIKQEEENK